MIADDGLAIASIDGAWPIVVDEFGVALGAVIGVYLFYVDYVT